ncbi:ATP-binding protein [Uliginosibacterium sp. 31-16]|uniref:sensor histidine kinase n=1 Tax=Uliginosibacterium sp. 31-16 TaxID=3068315 RepID=UPI00273D0359|nr:ATP-binding protein [Uliginosibacterium sp. 31-16]MDP5240102.1 ATP-binding protein [Uliginosibacterium sp. 31-16]
MNTPAPSHDKRFSISWLMEHLLRLRLLIALAVAFGLAVPALIIAHNEGAAVRQDSFKQLQADLQQLTEVSAEALRESLWQLYPEFGDSVAQAVFRDPRIRVLSVRNIRSPQPFLEYRRPLMEGESVMRMQREVRYKDQVIGSVDIYMSTAQAAQRAEAARQQILTRTLIGLTLSLLLIFLVMHWQLVRPIEYLKSMSVRLAGKDLSEPIQLPRRDELGELARSLEATRVSLAQAFTDLEEKNREVEEYAEDLELRVAERTNELVASNARLSEVIDSLQRAQHDLIEADRLASLGRMVAGIAHELNTPLGSSLTVMSTLLDHHRTISAAMEQSSLRRSQFDEFVAGIGEGLDIMQRNVMRAAEMVNKFRQVAVDQTSEQRRSFDLQGFIEEVQLALSPNFKHASIQLHTETAENIELDSYPGPLGQVLANLQLNALTHAFEGRDSGNIWLKAEALPPGRARLTVRDDGVGMSSAVREHIFDPFFTTRLGRGGSGLGLAIVYNIVTGILGGRVVVHSTPGEGSEFIIEIPLCAPANSTRKEGSNIGFG